MPIATISCSTTCSRRPAAPSGARSGASGHSRRRRCEPLCAAAGSLAGALLFCGLVGSASAPGMRAAGLAACCACAALPPAAPAPCASAAYAGGELLPCAMPGTAILAADLPAAAVNARLMRCSATALNLARSAGRTRLGSCSICASAALSVLHHPQPGGRCGATERRCARTPTLATPAGLAGRERRCGARCVAGKGLAAKPPPCPLIFLPRAASSAPGGAASA